MKVRNATICLDCDEIYESVLDSCPKCLNSKGIKLSAYFDPIDKKDPERVTIKRKYSK
jgi:hypothetical protein